MSEDEDKPKQKGIPLGSGFKPGSFVGVAKAVKDLNDFAAGIIAPESQMMKDVRAIQKKMAELGLTYTQYNELTRPGLYAPPHSGLYGKITEGLYDVEEAIDVIPEDLEEESSAIQPAEKTEFLNLYTALKTEFATAKDEIESLRQRLKTLEQEKRKIDSLVYPFPLKYLRGRMDRFLALNGRIFKGTWNSHPIEYNIGYFTPAHTETREVWNVYINPGIVIDSKVPGRTHFGMILAVEDQPDRTIVDFIDGQCYQRTTMPTTRSSSTPPIYGPPHAASFEPIGETFIKIAEWIKEGLNVSLTLAKLPEEPQTQNLTEWFDYFYKVKPVLRIKMEYIADKTGLAVSTVYKEHTLYKNSHDIQKRKTSVRKSKKK